MQVSTSKSIKKSSTSLFLVDFTLIFLIISSSFLVYFHHLVPDVKEWETVFFSITPKITPTVQALAYHTLVKISPIIFFSIWFITEKHWWRFSILVPIAFLSFQLISNLQDEFGILPFDSFELILVGVYLVLIVMINNYLKYYRFNIGAKFNIDSENLYLLPRSKENKSRITKVKGVLDQENLNRDQLNTIYKEYNYLNETSDYLKSEDFARQTYSFIPKLILEVLLALILVLTPLLLSLYDFVAPGVRELNFLGMNMPLFGFPDLRTFFWVVCAKIILIIPVSLWFFSNRHWWKYFLLIPFSVGLFQLLEILSSTSEVDGYKFFNLVPIILLISVVMVVLTRRFRNYVLLLEFYNIMEIKINKTIKYLSYHSQSEKKKNLKKELTALIKDHKKYAPSEYLERLKGIKKRLEELSKEQS